LSEDLLKIKAPLQREPASLRNSAAFASKDDEHNPDVVDAFGSLAINLSGKSRYYGHIANSVVRPPPYPMLAFLSYLRPFSISYRQVPINHC
jgi:hypothetical protein